MIAYDNILDDVFEVYEEVLQTKIVIKDPKDMGRKSKIWNLSCNNFPLIIS